MRPDSAALIVPLLQQSLSNVLEGAWTIAAVSRGEFEIYSELLAPARLGIYSVLTAIYAEHPDLDPLAGHSLAETATSEGGLNPQRHEDDRPLDRETMTRAEDVLEEACGLIDRAVAHIGEASGVEGQRKRFTGLCQEALQALRQVIGRLADQRAAL
jgi:hypothetical protein